MKRRRLLKLTSLILVLFMLVSCAPQNAVVSSSKTEHENQSAVSSGASKDETNSSPSISSKPSVEEPPGTENNTEQAITNDSSASETVNSKDGSSGLPYMPKISQPSSYRPSRNTKKYLNGLIVPIDYTDFIFGEEVASEATTERIFDGNKQWISHIAVVNTLEELEAVFQGEGIEAYSENTDYTKRYTNEFFEDKSLILLFVTRDSSYFIYSIEKIYKKDDILIISMNNAKYADGKEFYRSETMFRSFISVTKSDLEGINNILVCDKIS